MLANGRSCRVRSTHPFDKSIHPNGFTRVINAKPYEYNYWTGQTRARTPAPATEPFVEAAAAGHDSAMAGPVSEA